MRGTHLCTVGFEGGRRGQESGVQGCEWPPEAGRQETLQPLERNAALLDPGPWILAAAVVRMFVPRPLAPSLPPYNPDMEK